MLTVRDLAAKFIKSESKDQERDICIMKDGKKYPLRHQSIEDGILYFDAVSTETYKDEDYCTVSDILFYFEKESEDEAWHGHWFYGNPLLDCEIQLFLYNSPEDEEKDRYYAGNLYELSDEITFDGYSYVINVDAQV